MYLKDRRVVVQEITEEPMDQTGVLGLYCATKQLIMQKTQFLLRMTLYVNSLYRFKGFQKLTVAMYIACGFVEI